VADGVPGTEIRLTPVATSTRYKSLTVAGIEAKSGTSALVRLATPRTEVAIVVRSPDGSASTQYVIRVTRKD